MKHPESRRLSEYLDGGLTNAQARELEEHMSGCRECSDLLRELEDVQARAHALSDQLPNHDLWPGIARALVGEEWEEAAVIRLHPEVPAGPPERSRRVVRLSAPQAVAAGLALALVSGSVGSLLVRPSAEVPETAASAESSWMTEFAGSDSELRGVAVEVARLEELLAHHRVELGATTARVLEKNLQVMDRAIRESYAALQTDPGNAFLETHLTRAFRAKADYLRETAHLVAPAS
ncbi:anti-sigma factor family protein [Gemmatimonadota bacterium]